MIQIQQQPTSTTFVESMYDLIYDTDQVSIDVSIRCDGVLRQATYYANDMGEVVVRLRELVREMMMDTFSPADLLSTHRTRTARSVIVSASGGPSVTFIVLDGGYSATANVANYLNQWLTVSRADRVIPFTLPSYLQFYSYNAPKRVIAEAEMQDGATESAIMCEVASELNVQVNCRFDLMAGLFGQNPAAITLYIADANSNKLSKGVRFAPARDVTEHEDIYYYRNCVGAIEHVTMRGVRSSLSKKSEKKYENGWREKRTLGEPVQRSYKKSTGYNSRDKMSKEIRAFFESSERYVYKDRMIRPICIEESNYERSNEDYKDIEFEYSILGDTECVELDI